jgi:amino acid transporter
MSCFSLEAAKELLIWLVVLVVLVAIFKLVLPWLLGLFGGPPGGGLVFTILGYILWGIVAIFVIIVLFDLASCMLGSGGGGIFLNHR